MIAPPSDTAVDVDTRDALTDCILHFLPYINFRAASLASGDAELFKDLRQEALILLWTLDPSRFDDDDNSYLRQAIYTQLLYKYRSYRNARGGTRRVEVRDLTPFTDRSEAHDEE